VDPSQNVDPSQTYLLLFAFAMIAVFTLIVFVVFVLLGRLWLRALLHGTSVPIVRIIAMQIRGNPPSLLIDAYTTLVHSNVPTTLDAVERTYIESKHRILTSQDLVDIMKTRAAES